jgi:hypothetical protein
MSNMSANAATELNYLWKVRMVGQPYMTPGLEPFPGESPSGVTLAFTTFTSDIKINDMWEEGRICL